MLDHSAYILIAIGSFIFIISFIGYCGALQENRVLLTAYGLFLIIIFALQVILRIIYNLREYWYSFQITGIVLSGVYRSQADGHVRLMLKKVESTPAIFGS